MTPSRLVIVLPVASFAVATACASATAAQQQPEPSNPVETVASYPVHVDKIDDATLTDFSVAKGIDPPTMRTVGCPADLCDLLTDWSSPGAGWSVGRLSTGEYVHLATNNGGSWVWRRGRDIEAVTQLNLQGWPGDGETPRWVPSIEGYTFLEAKPVPDVQDFFVGLWETMGTSGPRYLLGLFKDQANGTIGFRGADRQPCVIATSNTPVIAFDAGLPLHGVYWGFNMILRPPRADHIQILGIGMFPQTVECMEVPA